MASINEIIPCVCTKIKEDDGSGYFGMPQIKIYETAFGTHRYSAYCPNCKRGDIDDFPSLYYALKSWNKMQEHLWKNWKLYLEDDELNGKTKNNEN